MNLPEATRGVYTLLKAEIKKKQLRMISHERKQERQE